MISRLTYICTLMMTLLCAVSCEMAVDDLADTVCDGAIVLRFSAGGVVAKGTVEDNEIESYLNHLDVIVYAYEGVSNGSEIYSPFYHERIDVSATPEGSVTLNKTVKDFEEDKEYKFFVIANTTHSTDVLYKDGSLLSYDNFLKLDQTDELIHLSGIDRVYTRDIYPRQFLMDGVAFAGNIEPSSPGRIVVNTGDATDDVDLNVILRRAAAKVCITICPGDKVTFTKELLDQSNGYMIRNMPIRTTLAAEGGYPLNDGGKNPYWESSSMSQSPYFKMIKVKDTAGVERDGLQLVAYCYSHSWEKDEVFEKGTSVVMMLPLLYQETPDSEPTVCINNYYQLSINDSQLIKRNTVYDLRVMLNAPGAEDYTKPQDIKNIQYFTAAWEMVDLEVGSEAKVKYLKVNKDKLYMYNIADDTSSLYFSSSSPITVTFVSNSAYYYNKYNVKTSLANNKVDIYATTESGAVSGNIHVHSDIPTNYTVRYFQLKVTNEEGMTVYVDVEQYPLIYIRNDLPWYSYRDDYYYRTGQGHTYATNLDKSLTSGDQPTTYRYAGDHMVSVETITGVDVNTKKVTYKYTSAYSNHNSRTGFTCSKVRGDKVKDSENYKINYYYFSYSTKDKKWTMGEYQCEEHNVRNYHVRVMASSEDYTVGRPELDEYGYTAANEENSKLVSPSFVIASRLGAVLSEYSGLSSMSNEKKLVAFADHCKNYVQVDDVNDDKKDPVTIADNWRLPTAAELKIIIDIQGTKGQNADAIDYLLNGGYYMSASGPVFNPKNDFSVSEERNPMDADDVAIRCVRDAF